MDVAIAANVNRSRMSRAAAAALLASAALAMTAVLGAGAGAADEDVSIANFAFSPESVTVNVGDTVTWTNSDSNAHTATGDGGEFHTGNLADGDSGEVTFDTAGTFAYHCELHPQMTGTVVVEAGAAVTNPPTDAVRGDRAAGGDAANPVGVLVGLLLATIAGVAWMQRRMATGGRRDHP